MEAQLRLWGPGFAGFRIYDLVICKRASADTAGHAYHVRVRTGQIEASTSSCYKYYPTVSEWGRYPTLNPKPSRLICGFLNKSLVEVTGKFRGQDSFNRVSGHIVLCLYRGCEGTI